jgi:type IV secretion system protein VirB10
MKWVRRRQSNDDIDAETIDGERTVASVNRGLRTQAKVTNYLVLATVVALTAFLLFKYYAAVFERRDTAHTSAGRDSTRAIDTTLPPLKPVLVPVAPPAAPPAPPPSTPATAAGNPAQPQLTPAQVAMNRRLAAGVLFKSTATTPATAGPSGTSAGASGADVSGSDSFAKSLQPSRPAAARAYMLEHPSMTVTKATAIPCTVIPAMDTTLPGLVSCIQKADVWSADGKVLLLERGTKWTGEQKAGMAQGQRRVGVLWTRGETPNHVLVDVDSPGADNLGRPGMSGMVDNHFWDRFGGAILISLIGDVGSYLAATQQSGNNNTAIALPGTINGAQSAMSEVLRSTINIPPTMAVNQGADVIIYVARDLDFSDVYGLEPK